ncbi:MAG: PaaI family thioesterase [Betaproteobacteria bacterium]|nr:PaaI family thioesterase [Betaproteobacteria bacterium]
MSKLRDSVDIENINTRSKGFLPGHFGFEALEIEQGRLYSRLPIRSEFMAPNGFLHAASVILLADTACGYATIAHLPEGATSFTTIELKSNFLATAKEGEIFCEARAEHLGRTTQIWSADVCRPDGVKMALFRCTQMILWPK